MSSIIRSQADLQAHIEDRLGDGVTRKLVEKLAGAAWQEAREAGYQPGQDWTDFLAGVDWLERAGDVIAADIQAKADRSGR
ncbi:MAG TPA: hypothetical protein VKA14_01975 [Gammaproteobacteria bacterium]|nr:hypothetical protein [Gammaproteobacteria bacterium]